MAARSAGVRRGGAIPGVAPLASLVARLGRHGSDRVASRLDEMREVLTSADALISPSRFLQERMADLGFAGCQVIPNGHEPVVSGSPIGAEPGSVRFGFIGSAIPSKGVHVLARAFADLGEPRATLRIHGPFPPYHGRSDYEARVREILGEAAGRVLAGPFPPHELERVLSTLDVVVVPSIWEENAPLVVQEAFLTGRPVVVSDHGGLAEMVAEGRGGLRFKPGDSADLARVMERFLREPGLAARLAAGAPRVPSMAGHASQIEAAYRRAIERRRRRVGRVGVAVLHHGDAALTRRAVKSVASDELAPAVVVVENGTGSGELPAGVVRIGLPDNVGYGAGMNAGIERLEELGCDRILLLNNDATLVAGSLRRLAEALDDESHGAVAPVVVSERSRRIESDGARFDPSWGRYRLEGHGKPYAPAEGRSPSGSLSGAVWMLRSDALARVGRLDEAYFYGFEDADWCARAVASGLELFVVRGAVAHHVGSAGLGCSSADRLYYAVRNHLRAVSRLAPRGPLGGALRGGFVLALNLGHSITQGEVRLFPALRAVREGARDFYSGRFGRRAL